MDNTTVTLIIFALTQLILLGGTLAAMKSDSNVLKTQMGSMKDELARQSAVLEKLADMKADFRSFDERLKMQGSRMDDLQRDHGALSQQFMTHVLGERVSSTINEGKGI